MNLYNCQQTGAEGLVSQSRWGKRNDWAHMQFQMPLCPQMKQLKKMFRKHLIYVTLLEAALWLLEKAVCQSRLDVNGRESLRRNIRTFLERQRCWKPCLTKTTEQMVSCLGNWRIQPSLQEIQVELYMGRFDMHDDQIELLLQGFNCL